MVILTMVNKFSSSKRGIRVSRVKLAEERWDFSGNESFSSLSYRVPL